VVITIEHQRLINIMIKKFIQLLFLLILTHAVLAQENFYNQYMITVSGVGSTGGDPNINCQSGFEYSVIFESGDRSIVVPLVGVDGPGNTNFSGYLVFSSQNKVKSLFLHTKDQRKHGLGENCEGGTITDREIIFNPQYPCHNRTITHSDGSYSFTTTIEILPLSKKSIRLSTSVDMRNNANEDFANHPYINIYQPPARVGPYKTNFSYSLSATVENSPSRTMLSGGTNWLLPGATISRQHSMIFPLIKKPVALTLTSLGTVELLIRTDTESSGEAEYTTVVARLPSRAAHNFPTSDLQVPGTTTFNFSLYPSANPGRITLTTSTFSLPIKYGPDATNILPYDTANRITILGPAGNPSAFYHWVYSTDLATWIDLPAKFQGQQRLSISGYDLQGEEFMRYHNTNVFFKLVIDCSGDESDVLTLSRRISAPNIVNVTPMPDRCFDKERDGAFRIVFSRPLFVHESGAKETLNILVRDLSNVNAPAQILDVTLGADNSLTWPRQLQSDRQYEISMIDTYLGASTYSDDKINHYDTVELIRPLPISSVMTPEAVHCYNGADGKISLVAQGGAGNYIVDYVRSGTTDTTRISFGTGTTTEFSFLPQGTYRVHVRDGNNCGDRAGVKSVIIHQPLSPLSVAYSATTDPRAYGYTDGSIETVVTGGTPYPDKRYTVAWYDPSALLPESLQNNAVLSEGYQANISSLGDGSYVLKAYDSQYEIAHPDHRAGCYAESEIFRLLQPAALAVTIGQHHEVSCRGYTDGALSAFAQGGIKIQGSIPYLYIWLKEENGELVSIGQSDSTAVTLTAGTYRVKIIDMNNIEKLSDVFTLTEPDSLKATVSTTPVSCNSGADGTVSITAHGGTAPYTYEWSVPGTDPFIAGLPAETYYAVVSDIKGCIYPTSGTVLSPDIVTSEITTDPVHCNGGGDGKINLVAHGGSGEYYFTFGRAGAMDPERVAFAADNVHVIDLVSEGTYQVEIRDGNNCVDVALAKTIYVAQPLPLELKLVSIINPRGYGYNDGSIEAELSGGTAFSDGHYTQEWYDPVNLLPGTLYAGNNLSDRYHAQLLNVGDGTFFLQAYDSAYTLAHPDHRAGCSVKSEMFSVVQPPPLEVSIYERHFVSCHGFNNGEIEAHAIGGVKIETGLPYRYEWFKDEQNETNPVGQADSVALQLRSGTYRVKITDSNGVEKISEPFFLVEPQTLRGQVITTPISCNSGVDGTAFATVQGGTLPYSYEWSSQHSEALATQLIEGAYFVLVTDARGCTTTASGRVISPYALKVDSLVSDPQCSGYTNGSIDLTIREGSAPYRYEWSNGATTQDIAGLSSGQYTALIFDRNNCRNYRRFTLTDPAPVKIELGGERKLCNSQHYVADATIQDPAAHYQWSGPNGFSAQTSSVSLTAEGIYQVIVTDAQGCTGEDELTIKGVGVDIGSEFIVTTQAFAGEEVTLLNISAPAPDSIHWWMTDRAGVNFTEELDTKASLVFSTAGTYTVSLTAYRQGCEAVSFKTITVVERSFEDETSVELPFIEDFSVSPNPSRGAFSVTVSLRETSSIRLRLFSIVNNTMINDRQEQGSNQYVVPYTVNLAAGTYLLLLETPQGGDSLLKVIVY
jgi:hypothetical protein